MTQFPRPNENRFSNMKNRQIKIPLDTLLVQGLWLLLCLVGFLVILVLNDNQFTYTLDDPYIHLAVAEQITHGNYGVNLGEFCSPASSILWPFLLAPFARLPFGDLAPLFLNVLFGALTGALVLSRLRRLLPDSEKSDWRSPAARAALVWCVLLLSNAPGLVFTGMEHSLQLLLAVAAIDGMLALVLDEPLEWWHWTAILLGPSVRYENLSLTAGACLLFAMRRRRKTALLLGAASLVPLAAFSAFLVVNGLPPLPSSVIAKAAMIGGSGGIAATIRQHLDTSLLGNRGLALAAPVLALLALGLSRRRFDATAQFALAAATAGLLHMLAGAYGWFHRYEAYAMGAAAFALLSAALLAAGKKREALPTKKIVLPAALATLLLAYPYLLALPTIPVAANNIYEQQYQMHRFLSEFWKRPAAVNDLGLTSFRNNQYILDLWGLASHEAFVRRMAEPAPVWMDDLARKHDVQLALIYKDAFPARPANWTKVAELRLSRPRITPAGSRVSFYATNPANAREIEALVLEFRKSLPPGVAMPVASERNKVR
jgi:hypothetical protein